jgi:opacity protein-like surface antigen
MKYLAIAALAYLIISPAAAEQIEIPRAFQGEWCGDGGTCPNGWMTVTKSGFTGANGTRCDLKKADYRAQETGYRHYRGLWKLTFKCTDSKTLVEERWFFVDEMLVVTFDLPNGGPRFVQYLPRIKRDQG